jgi:aldose 1-epimerase
VSTIERQQYGVAGNGGAVHLFTLANARGVAARIITYGGTIVSLDVPDANGRIANIVLTRRDLAEYESAKGHYGATIGRYANRIANGCFTLDGATYHTSRNNGKHTLHGGASGFDKRIWDVESYSSEDGVALLRLKYVSEDGEQGFPGRLETFVTFALDDAGALDVTYEATTDKATVVNFTNHSYFNLSGEGCPGVAEHLLQIDAAGYTPVDAELIPTGEIAPVDGTIFDFRNAVPVGTRDFDINFVLKGNGNRGEDLRLAATACDPRSGRQLDVLTSEPGLQFYNNRALNGFALETQHFPDSPNRPQFPSTVLRPGERFWSRTTYRCSY